LRPFPVIETSFNPITCNEQLCKFFVNTPRQALPKPAYLNAGLSDRMITSFTDGRRKPMALVNRLSRLFQADFHAVLDRIEEPDIQLKQAVREMQLALDQDEQRLNLLQHETEQLNKADIAASEALLTFDEELNICLAAEKEDLARDLIRRKLTSEKQQLSIKQQSEIIESQIKRLDKQINQQHQQLTSMKQKLELLVDDENRGVIGQFSHADNIRTEEIEIALLREKELREKQRRAQS